MFLHNWIIHARIALATAIGADVLQDTCDVHRWARSDGRPVANNLERPPTGNQINHCGGRVAARHGATGVVKASVWPPPRAVEHCDRSMNVDRQQQHRVRLNFSICLFIHQFSFTVQRINQSEAQRRSRNTLKVLRRYKSTVWMYASARFKALLALPHANRTKVNARR